MTCAVARSLTPLTSPLGVPSPLSRPLSFLNLCYAIDDSGAAVEHFPKISASYGGGFMRPDTSDRSQADNAWLHFLIAIAANGF